MPPISSTPQGRQDRRYHPYHHSNDKENERHSQNPIFDENLYRAALEQPHAGKQLPRDCQDMLDVYTHYLKFLKQSSRMEEYDSLLAMAFADKSLRQGACRQDIRLFRILVTYAHHTPSDNPLWVFEMMSKEQLCTKLSMFYLAVATIHESNENLDEARSKFEEALRLRKRGELINADKLDSMYEQFMIRYERATGTFARTRRTETARESRNSDNNQRRQPFQQTLGFDKKLTHPNGTDEQYSLEEARAMLPRYQCRPSPPPTVSTVRESQESSMFMDDEGGYTVISQPTIHTKLATDEIMSMFNGPIGEEEENIFEQKKRSNQHLMQQRQRLQQQQQEQQEPTPNAPKKFAIFEDEENDGKDFGSTSNTTTTTHQQRPFQIFEDEESENKVPQENVATTTTRCEEIAEALHKIVERDVNNKTINLKDTDFARACAEIIAPTLHDFHQIPSTVSIRELDGCDMTTLRNKVAESGSVTIDLPDCLLHLWRNLQQDRVVFSAHREERSCPQLGEDVIVKLQPASNGIMESNAFQQVKNCLKSNNLSHGDMQRRFSQSCVMYQYRDTALLLKDECNFGTLQDMLIVETKSLDEHVVIFLTMELLKILIVLHHRAHILHGALRPDILLIRNADIESWGDWTLDGKNGWDSKGLKLGDMGNAVNLSLFPDGIQVTLPDSDNSGYGTEIFSFEAGTCNRKFDIDLAAVCGIVYRMLFGKDNEMHLTQDSVSHRWKPDGRFKTTWKARDMWIHLFDTLLNIPPSQYSENTLQELLSMFKNHAMQHASKMRLVPSLWRKSIAAVKDRLV